MTIFTSEINSGTRGIEPGQLIPETSRQLIPEASMLTIMLCCPPPLCRLVNLQRSHIFIEYIS